VLPAALEQAMGPALTQVNAAASLASQGHTVTLGRGTAVLTFEDCLGLCQLSEEEIRAIAEHEHVPQIVALELGNYLMRGPDGEFLVSHMLIDDIRAAERRGDLVHAAQLKQTLRHFLEEHMAKMAGGAKTEGGQNR
jgi:hypothetical protein